MNTKSYSLKDDVLKISSAMEIVEAPKNAIIIFLLIENDKNCSFSAPTLIAYSFWSIKAIENLKKEFFPSSKALFFVVEI